MIGEGRGAGSQRLERESLRSPLRSPEEAMASFNGQWY
jgi:hypothetical protein